MTLPAAGTCDFQPFWANTRGVCLEFAEMQYKMFLRSAGRVMTLPYGCGTVNGNLSHPLASRDARGWGGYSTDFRASAMLTRSSLK